MIFDTEQEVKRAGPTPRPWEVRLDGSEDAMLEIRRVGEPSVGNSIACAGYASEPEDVATAHLIAAAPSFLAACGPEGDPELDRLGWLSALLAHLREIRYAESSNDPEAAWTALAACECLLSDMRAARRKAGGTL